MTTRFGWLGIVACGVLAAIAIGDDAAAKPAASAVAGWRGDGTGTFFGATPPTQWDGEKKQGILWNVKVGKTLYNSPVISGGKVFVLVDPDKLVCLDATTGKEIWSKTTRMGDYPEKVEELPEHEEVANTTPTPVTDGRSIYVVFANGLVTSFDVEGNRKWITFLNQPCSTAYGQSASPCLVDGKLVVSAGFLTALEAQTGKVAWKAEKVTEQFGSPVAAKVGDLPVVVAASGHVLKAGDGTVLAKGFGELTYASPLVVGDKAYFMDSDFYGMQLGKDGAEIKKLWRGEMEGEYFASPVCLDGLIYAVGNNGLLSVVDAKDGKLVYDKKLPIANMSGEPDVAVGNVYPSLCVAGGHVYISNEQGETLVIEPGREYKEIAHNQLGGQIAGSMAFAGKRIYVRTNDGICCIGE